MWCKAEFSASFKMAFKISPFVLLWKSNYIQVWNHMRMNDSCKYSPLLDSEWPVKMIDSIILEKLKFWGVCECEVVLDLGTGLLENVLWHMFSWPAKIHIFLISFELHSTS